MVKKRKKNIRKDRVSKRFNTACARARNINASTGIETCGEQLSPFGGLLGLIKFLDLFDFRDNFNETYIAPSREPKLGHYVMVLGILMLIFIGFNRIWHFENLVGEAKREGLEAIPSGKFKNNYAFFQITMLAYNIWRYFKMLAQKCDSKAKSFAGIQDNTIRIARLKLLMIAAKLVRAGNREEVKYSIHDSRTPGLLRFYSFLDRLRFKKCVECRT